MKIEQIQAAAEAQLSCLNDPSTIKIYVGSSMGDANVGRILALFQNEIDRGNLQARIVRTGSFGCYDLEPIVTAKISDSFAVLYNNVDQDSIADLISDLIQGMPGKAKPYCFIGDKRWSGIPHISQLPLFSLQNRIALRNCGWIDPEDIDHYISQGQGYTGLSKALRMSPPDVAGLAIPSVLKSRCGPGCSNIDRWELFAGPERGNSYLICNAIDPNPRSLTSRLLLDSDPHSVLEGMLIAAYAIGASYCAFIVGNRAEDARRLRKALDQMRKYNLLGSNILDSQFCSEIEIKEAELMPAGYWIELLCCWEEKRLSPHMLPAGPFASEFIGKPWLIVNPEMMSSLSAVLRNDKEARTESKVVTLSGSVIHPYTVEVSSEVTLGSIIEILGGGAPNGKTIKAVQIGGPAGPLFAPSALRIPVSYDVVEESGSIEVIDAESDIVDAVRDRFAYLQTQSCGKCVFCREGCLQILTILEDLLENRGKAQDLDLLVALCEEMKTACLCSFGRAVPNPVLSSINLFRAEYEKRFPVPRSPFPVV